MAEHTKIPARILLQVREGTRHNVLAEFDLLTRETIQNPDGTLDHSASVASLVSGLAIALRDAINDLEEDGDTKAWLRELRDWTFKEAD
jgi:hypothetical protein